MKLLEFVFPIFRRGFFTSLYRTSLVPIFHAIYAFYLFARTSDVLTELNPILGVISITFF